MLSSATISTRIMNQQNHIQEQYNFRLSCLQLYNAHMARRLVSSRSLPKLVVVHSSVKRC